MFGSILSRVSVPAGARLFSSNADLPAAYPQAVKLFHWGMAAGILSCVGLVKAKQFTDDKEQKMKMMWYHKSFGLLCFGMIAPRIVIRLGSKMPAPPAGSTLEHLGAKVTHFALYAGMVVMPMTGVAMGYFGGKGLPFFFTTIPGAKKEDRKGYIAKNAFKIHKQVGNVFQYIIPLHIGAFGFHFLKGQNLLLRMNPFK